MKTTRRLFALLMVVCLLAGYAVMPVYAADAAATMTFEAANRTAFSAEQQVWEQNGITLTNDKGGSTNDVADYVNPARFYKGSSVKIEYPGMTKLVFTCSGAKYTLKEADVASLGTLTTEDLVMTLVLNEAADSIEFVAGSNQVRLSKLEVYTGDVSDGDSGDSGDSEEPSEPEVVIPTDPTEIVDAAYALEKGASLDYTATLTGMITKINSAYSEKYGNISVTIVVDGRDNKPIQCYRMVGTGVDTLEIGDTITCTGILKNYNGTIEFDADCTLDAVVEGPDAPETAAEIVAAAYELANYKYLPYEVTLTGAITSIDTEYSEQYGNITVTITVEGCEDKPIMCYRMKGDGIADLAVGDTITVTGVVKNYKGTVEFDSGCTLDAVVKAPVAGETIDIYGYQWEWDWMGTEATITVTVPANTYNTYILYNVDGMLLTINDGEPQKMTAPGFMMPCEVVITNETDADAEYVLKLVYPVGAAENPDVLVDTATAVLEADSQGYYYTYTATETGAVEITVSGDGWFYCVNNLTSWKYGENHYSTDEPVVPSEIVMVNEGDELQIIVNTLDPANPYGGAPAGEVTVTVEKIAAVEPVEGETVTIEVMEWQWNEDNTEGTLTVTVPAGTYNTYIANRLGGMQLSVNNGEPTPLEGNLWNPPSFVIANDMPFDQEYTLVVNYPLGHMQNPNEIWMLGEQLADLAAGDEDGYYYIYTADSDATLHVTVNGVVSETENAVADVVVFNATTYAQKSVLGDGVDGLLTLDVTAGDVLNIQVVMMPDAEWVRPAAMVNWEINYPAGTEMNPLYPEFVWNEDQTSGEATVTVGAGETVYIALTQSGAELKINGGETIVITGNRYMPQILPIENGSEQAADLVLTVGYPVGSYENPAELVAGENKTALEAGSQGWYYEFVAPSDGTVTVTVTGDTWQYYAANNTQSIYSDPHYYDDETVVNTETIEVQKGDEVLVFVNTYGLMGNPAGEVTVTFSFESAVLLGDVNGDGVVGISDLMRLANHFAKGVEINEANADCNGDGTVTISDLMRLANYFAGKAQLG